MTDTTTVETAQRQIEFARAYTLSLLDDIDPSEWFDQLPGCVTHVAWQVGHLAMAEYGLCLFRPRGRAEIDTELMSSRFRKKFSKGTTPDFDASNNPSPAEIRDVFDRVHQQVLEELPGYTADQINAPVDEPRAVFDTNLGGLFFCGLHEMMHAGQIGLLRRLLGKAPIR